MPDKKPQAGTIILQILKQRPGLTAHELARALGVTPVAVRKQLESLEQQGLVAVALRRQPMGRPSYIYRLTPDAASHFPQGYRQMLLDILQELATVDGEQKVKRLLEDRSAQQLRSYERNLRSSDFETRLRELIRLRNEEGYMTELEESPEAYVLRQHNCPVEDVSRRFRQTCGCEIDLLRRLLRIKHVERIAAAHDGDPSCAYRIPKTAVRATEGER